MQTTRTLHKNSGVAMVLVLCVSALFLALAAALAWSAAAVSASANRQLSGERAYQLAQSFSQVLGEELAAEESDDNTFRALAVGFMDDGDADGPLLYTASGLADGYGSELTVTLEKAAENLLTVAVKDALDGESFTYTLTYRYSGGEFSLYKQGVTP